MSQQKVDQYKKEKANRQQIIRRKKITRNLQLLLAVLIVAALVGWFATSLVRSRMAQSAAAGTTIDVTSLDDYLTEMSSYTAQTDSETAADSATE